MANQRRKRSGGTGRRTRANKPSIDLSTIEPEALNRCSEEWGERLARRHRVKTNQIRNLYSAVQQIRVRADQPGVDQEDINRRLIFLKPKLAYASGRQPALKALRDFLVPAIDSVVNSRKPQEARENFFFLMESIVAYHKFYGGRDS